MARICGGRRAVDDFDFQHDLHISVRIAQVVDKPFISTDW